VEIHGRHIVRLYVPVGLNSIARTIGSRRKARVVFLPYEERIFYADDSINDH
jgi:hypothetical protein